MQHSSFTSNEPNMRIQQTINADENTDLFRQVSEQTSVFNFDRSFEVKAQPQLNANNLLDSFEMKDESFIKCEDVLVLYKESSIEH